MTAPDVTTNPQIRVYIGPDVISDSGLLAEVARDDNGALNLFLGVTRDHHDGRAVSGLEYHCYLPMALAQLEKLCAEVAASHQLTGLVVLHRIGPVAIGEVSLAIAAGAHHRRQALLGTLELIDRLKADVPIWKRESFTDGTIGWVEGADITPVPNQGREQG